MSNLSKPVKNETDITWIGVVFIIASLGFIIVSASNYLSLDKKTTSSRASESVKPDHAACQALGNKPLGISYYDSSADRCHEFGLRGSTECAATEARDPLTWSQPKGCNALNQKCCRPVTKLTSIGDPYCKMMTKDQAAVCVDELSSCPAGRPATTQKCGLITNAGVTKIINQARCCAIANPTPTPSIQPTTATEAPGKNVNDCGPSHFDCYKTWTTGKNDSRSFSNKDKSGKELKADCFGTDKNDINTFRCVVQVDNSVTACDGKQWAYPIKLKSGGIESQCYMTVKGQTAVETEGQLFKVCEFVKKVKQNGNGYTITECIDEANKN